MCNQSVYTPLLFAKAFFLDIDTHKCYYNLWTLSLFGFSMYTVRNGIMFNPDSHNDTPFTTAAKPSNLKTNNRKAVLNLLRKHALLSVTEISELTGLSRTTAMKTINFLQLIINKITFNLLKFIYSWLTFVTFHFKLL